MADKEKNIRYNVEYRRIYLSSYIRRFGHWKSYLNYVYKTISSYGLTPHELNMKREEKMEEVEKGFKDVPVSGYDNFGIVKYNINMTINNITIEHLRNCVAANGNISVFLWYDFTNNNKNLNIPIITW